PSDTRPLCHSCFAATLSDHSDCRSNSSTRCMPSLSVTNRRTDAAHKPASYGNSSYTVAELSRLTGSLGKDGADPKSEGQARQTRSGFQAHPPCYGTHIRRVGTGPTLGPASGHKNWRRARTSNLALYPAADRSVRSGQSSEFPWSRSTPRRGS